MHIQRSLFTVLKHLENTTRDRQSSPQVFIPPCVKLPIGLNHNLFKNRSSSCGFSDVFLAFFIFIFNHLKELVHATPPSTNTNS